MLEWISGVIKESGYAGIAWLMLLENVVPPIPSELIVPLAGYVAASGALQFWGVVAAGTAGSVGGAVGWYLVGRAVSAPRLRAWIARHGQWVGIDEHEFDRVQRWLERYCWTVVFVGRLIPGIRTLVSVPAGLAGMSVVPFVLWSAAGTLVWVATLAYVGRQLGDRYALVHEILDPIATVVVGALLLTFVWRVVRQARRRRG